MHLKCWTLLLYWKRNIKSGQFSNLPSIQEAKELHKKKTNNSDWKTDVSKKEDYLFKKVDDKFTISQINELYIVIKKKNVLNKN